MKTNETDVPANIRALRALARQHAEAAIETLAQIMKDTDQPAGVRVSAAKALLGAPGARWGRKPRMTETASPFHLSKE